MARDGVPLIVIQRQLGHTSLGVTSIYLQESTVPRSSTPSTPTRTDDPGRRLATPLSFPSSSKAVAMVSVPAEEIAV
jgi:hypothetical protein